jgi:hypothetical protein
LKRVMVASPVAVLTEMISASRAPRYLAPSMTQVFFEDTLVELIAGEARAGVFGDVGGRAAEVAAGAAAGGDKALLRRKAERVGVGGSDEGIDLHDLHVVFARSRG